MTEEKNPYAQENGAPIPGKEPDFFAWARKKELERREGLPEDERKEIEDSERALRDRMDS